MVQSLSNTKWTYKQFPKTFNFCQSGEISPNLVTLVPTFHQNVTLKRFPTTWGLDRVYHKASFNGFNLSRGANEKLFFRKSFTQGGVSSPSFVPYAAKRWVEIADSWNCSSCKS